MCRKAWAESAVSKLDIEQVMVRRMISEVAEQWGTTPAAICGPSKKLRIYSARKEVQRRLRYDFRWTLKEIGFLTNRDHSSVIHNTRTK